MSTVPGLAPGLMPGGISADAIIASLAPKFWLDAGYGTARTGSDVDSWTDRTAGLVLTPAYGVTKGIFSASDANYLGQPSVTFTDYGVQKDTGLTTDASFTQVILTTPSSATGGYKSLFQVNNGRIYSRMSSAAWGVYVLADASSASTLSAGIPYGLVVLATAYNDITFRTNGVSHTATNGAGYSPNAAMQVIVGGWYAAAQAYDGSVALALYWDRVLSGGELALLSSATQRKWGVSLQ